MDLPLFEKIVTIIAGFATAGGLIFVGYKTFTLRKERKLTLRAWIGIGEPHWYVYGYLDNDDKFVLTEVFENLSKDEQSKFQRLRRYIEIRNYGQIPAEKLKTRLRIITGRQPTKNDIENTAFDQSSTMMPSASMKLFTVFSAQEESIIEDPQGELYVIWEAEYESPKGKIRKHGEISRISQRIYIPIENWDEES
ncbi:MAG: hypothetical protein KGI33_12370 [Thaumarchaeota archaeon]|nr:hypothetical protein [Nitrososphaerota archaeon]